GAVRVDRPWSGKAGGIDSGGGGYASATSDSREFPVRDGSGGSFKTEPSPEPSASRLGGDLAFGPKGLSALSQFVLSRDHGRSQAIREDALVPQGHGNDVLGEEFGKLVIPPGGGHRLDDVQRLGAVPDECDLAVAIIDEAARDGRRADFLAV